MAPHNSARTPALVCSDRKISVKTSGARVDSMTSEARPRIATDLQALLVMELRFRRGCPHCLADLPQQRFLALLRQR